MKKEMIGMICAIALAACPFEAMAGSGSIEQGWELFNKAIQKADKQWVKDESLKGIERCEMRHSNAARQPIEYVAKNQGRFITVQGRVFCTHDKSSFGYSFESAENGYVVGLFVLNKSAGEIEKYAYRGWTDHGQLWDSRVFMSTSLSSGFPRAITLRNSQAGGNDVFHLSEFIDQDNYVIESEDPAFTVSFTSAYRDIFECNKR